MTATAAPTIRSVLVLGSGPIVIGQAAEFDYAGTQACRALREEGVRTILVNSNPATIMTDEGVADAIYIEPLTPEVVKRVIQRERPDGLLPTLGGRPDSIWRSRLRIEEPSSATAFACLVRLLPRSNRRKIAHCFETSSIGSESRLSKARSLPRLIRLSSSHLASPLPLVIRPAYTLGGTGGGVATTTEELERIVNSGLNASPIHQVLLERSLAGWKEIEYEVMRDGAGTCITICNMENFDPMGVHTGDSIVVAPSQTLTDDDYQMLRSSALRIIDELGIEGGCNVQFALDPESADYAVIEVNPRVSRSSALASKATGYPIARMAAKIAIGRRLDELMNPVTRRTTAAFEPALDYVVVKIPRWPFDKFSRADRTIGTQMKATGEVMAIDRSFQGALHKAMRSLESGAPDVVWEDRDLDRREHSRISQATERHSTVGSHRRDTARSRRRGTARPQSYRSLVSAQPPGYGSARTAARARATRAGVAVDSKARGV